MKRRYVFAGLVAVVVVAVASPALGGPSLRSLVKKEVKKQLAGKTGPAAHHGHTESPREFTPATDKEAGQ